MFKKCFLKLKLSHILYILNRNTEADTVWKSYDLLPQTQSDDLSSSFCASQIRIISQELEDIKTVKFDDLMSSSESMDGSIFVVLNGENSGVRISYHPKCLGTLVSEQFQHISIE